MTSIEKIAERLLDFDLVPTDELTRLIEVALFAAPSLEHGPTIILATWIKTQMSLTIGGHPEGLLGGIQDLLKIEEGCSGRRHSLKAIQSLDGVSRRISSGDNITIIVALQWMVDSWAEASTDECVGEGLTNVGAEPMPDISEIEFLISKLLGSESLAGDQ